MKKKKIIIFLFTGILITGIFAYLLLQSYKKDKEKLDAGQAYLENYEVKEAFLIFKDLNNSFWFKKQSHLGLLITNILMQADSKDNFQELPDPQTININGFFLPYLMKRQISTAAFKKCLKLSQIAAFYQIKISALFKAIALFELGDPKKAYQIYNSLPKDLKDTLPGRRFIEAYKLFDSGAQHIIRDRTGKIIGLLDIHQNFNFLKPEYQFLFQPIIIKELLHQDIKNGMRLSFDLELSRIALKALGENRGSVVIIEPRTGEILAAVSDQITSKNKGRISSPAFEQMLEPASISKLITITAALRNHLNPDQEINGKICNGAKRYSGRILYCPAAQGQLQGLEHALAVSCNTAFADLGEKIGWDQLVKELHLFGFNQPMNNPIPMGKILKNTGDTRELADLAIGLENTTATTVHAALIATVFANKGYWVNPHFISASDGFTGLSPVKFKRTPGKKILKEQWLPLIYDAMEAVTNYGGTACHVAPYDYPVYMKTGTGGNRKNGYHINYIGFTSGNNRDISFAVRVTHQKTSPRARKAGFIVSKFLLTNLKKKENH